MSMHMHGVFAASLVAVAGLCHGQTAHAQMPKTNDSASVVNGPAARPPGSLAVSTSRVVIFKDGHAMMVKTARGTPDERGRVHTDQVPDAAILGCFWATRADGEILGMHAEWIETTSIRPETGACTSMLELLRANTGRQVRCEIITGPDKTLSGTILKVLESPALDGPRPNDRMVDDAVRVEPGTPSTGPTITPILPVGGQYVALMREDGQMTVLPVSEIRAISGAELATSVERSSRVTQRSKRLSFDVGKSDAPVTISYMYFTSGLRWIPTYRLGMSEKGETAELALQGEILNELEDIDNVPVDLVVGVPNFRFKDIISPLTLEKTVRNALNAAAPSIMGRQTAMSNAMFSQRASEWAGQADNAGDGGGSPAEIGMGGEQDLFVYSVPRMTIGKGDRATLPIWRQPTGVSHLYTFDLDVIRDPEQRETYYRSGRPRHGSAWEPPTDRDSPLQLSANEVWHQLELGNASETPWTTGAALVLGAGKGVPICQELLTYTSVGGRALLPLTVAVDMRGKFSEEELSRRGVDVVNTAYQLIRYRGTLEMINNRKEASRTRVTIDVGGKVEKASDEGKIRLMPYNAADWGNRRWDLRPNGHSQVTWDIELKPGETRTLTIEGEYYWRP